MNRGARRLPIFGDDDDRSFFLRCVGEALRRADARVHAYVLMGNHYHLLVEGAVPALADTMKYVGENYTRRFNSKYGLDGPLFRGRYRSKPIDTERYLRVVLRYIHRNPVDDGHGGLDYEWSSHRSYTAGSPRLPWLTIDELLGCFASCDTYRRFMAVRPSDARVDPFVERRGSVRTGTPDAVDWALGIDSREELDLVRVRGLRADLRLAAALLALETTNRSSTELAAHYGYRSGSGVRTAASRARTRLGSDATFSSLVEDARRRLRFLDDAA
jgi:REP element-mobilizing transposase RayT